MDCNNNLLKGTLQIRAQEDTFNIGTSSILLSFNPAVLDFLSYRSLNFHPANRCIPGLSVSSWDQHNYNASLDDFFNLTLVSTILDASCPSIDNDWIDIGELEFTVENINASPNFQFDQENTNFNRNVPNDGTQAPQKGILVPYDELMINACACSQPVLLPDTLFSYCPVLSAQIPLLENDIVSNATLSLGAHSGRYSASINNNQLFIQTDSVLCGTEEIVYKVCNDGKEECCIESKVVIISGTEISPILSNVPEDITVSCTNIPSPASVHAENGCGTVIVSLDERRHQTSCQGVLIRTWTAVDQCGNVSSDSQRIEIIDTIKPEINCPENYRISCIEFTNPASVNSGNPLVTDNCTPIDQIQVSFQDEPVVSGNCINGVSGNSCHL